VSSVEDDDRGSRLWFGLVLIEHRFEFDSMTFPRAPETVLNTKNLHPTKKVNTKTLLTGASRTTPHMGRSASNSIWLILDRDT